MTLKLTRVSHWMTMLGFATITAAATLTVLWPKQTLADDDANELDDLSADGTRVGNHIVVDGEIVRDAKSKTGWVIEITAKNQGTEEETARVETDLTRTISNPMARAQPRGTTVWKHDESMTLVAGEKVTKRYVIPAPFGAQLTATARAEEARNKAIEAGKPVSFAMSAHPFFRLEFKKGHA